MSERRFRVSARARRLADRTGYSQFDELLITHWGGHLPMQGFMRDNQTLAEVPVHLKDSEPIVVRDWVDEICRAALAAPDIADRIDFKDLVPIVNKQGLADNKLGFRLQQLDKRVLTPHIVAAIYGQKAVFRQYNQGGKHSFPLPGSLEQMGRFSSLTYMFYVETENPSAFQAEERSVIDSQKDSPNNFGLFIHEDGITRFITIQGYPLKSATLYRVHPALPASNPAIERFFLEQARSEGKIGSVPYWLHRLRMEAGSIQERHWK